MITNGIEAAKTGLGGSPSLLSHVPSNASTRMFIIIIIITFA